MRVRIEIDASDEGLSVYTVEVERQWTEGRRLMLAEAILAEALTGVRGMFPERGQQ